MSIDLNATGAKVINGSGGGTSFADPLTQTIQISQTTLGNVPVTELNLEAAIGTTADPAWVGSGAASLVALLKAIASREGIGGAVADGSGQITTSGTAQNLFSGLTPVNGYAVQNNSAAILWINDVGVASVGGSSIQLSPGFLWVTPPGYKPPGAVSIFGNASGQAFTARKW